MVDASSVSAALTSLQTAFDIAKGLSGMRREADIKAAVTEIQSALMDAQSRAIEAQQGHSTLLQAVRDLEEQVAEFEAWEADKQRYYLEEIAKGQFAYSLKETESTGEPPHKLCANCYTKNEKSILQTEVRNPGRHTVLFCQRCGAKMFSPDNGGRTDASLPTQQNSGGGSWVRARRGQR